MAKDRKGSRGVKSSSAKPMLPWRPVRDWPSGIFVDDVVTHIKETGQPETMSSLYRNALAKDEEFQIVRAIEIDGKKRPEGDNAPCPMCTPNRFLSGSLVFLPRLQACAVIGHCCADKVVAARAEREHKFRLNERYEEDYLLASLPSIDARMEILRSLRSPAAEATRMFRRFRKDLPNVQSLLRSTKHQYSGRLVLVEPEEEEKDKDYFGPAGFKGGTSEPQEIDFGLLGGELAVVNDFNPIKELDNVIRQLESIGGLPDENAAMDFICDITDAQRRAAVAILEDVDKGAEKVRSRLRGFASFISRENAEVMNAFGTSVFCNLPFAASFSIVRGRPELKITRDRTTCRFELSKAFDALDYEWPGKKVIRPK